MAEASASADNWELAGGIRLERSAKGWTMLGGWDEDGGVGFRVVVHHPESDELVRRVEVFLPITVGEDGQVEIGEPQLLG